jgi:catechol 2,3-dioxygenase-like lactoylglutathione lyase family enzyme
LYDLMIGADFMVPDPDATMKTFVSALGMPEPKPQWRQAPTRHAYVAWFARVHKSFAIAPTTIEPQGHRHLEHPDDPFFPEHLADLARFQGVHRPHKLHATLLATRRFEELVEKLARRGVPFRLAPDSGEMPMDRIWIGISPETLRYDPSYDGGLAIEVLPTQALRLPEETFQSPPPEPRDPEPGQMIRVVSRSHIVRDLDDTLRRCSMYLDFEPAGPVELIKEEGYLRARMHHAVPQSATIEIIQPIDPAAAVGRYLSTWGPGPYATRIAVHDLAAKCDDLTSRGTGFTDAGPSSAVNGRRVLVDPAATEGLNFELVEYEPLS